MGQEWNQTLRSFGESFANIAAMKRKTRQDELDEKIKAAQIANLEADNLRQQSATDLANKARMESTALSPEIAESLSKYSLLRGGPSGEGRYQPLSDSIPRIAPELGASALSFAATNPADTVSGSGALTGAMDKSPLFEKARAEDEEKVALSKLTPRQVLNKQPWAGSDLPSAQKGRELFGAMQQDEEDAAKAEQLAYEKEQDRLNRIEAAIMASGNRKNKNAIFDDSPEGEQDLNDYVDRIASGDVSPDMKDLTSRGAAGANARMKAQALFKKKYPDLHLQQEVNAYNYWNHQATKKQLQVMDVVSEQLPNLIEATKELKMAGVPFLDRKTLEARRAAGDVAAAKYLAAFSVTVEDVAKGVAGGNALTDDQLKLANQIIYKGGTPEQVMVLAEEIDKGVNARKMTVYKRGGLQAKKYAEDDPWLTDEMRQRIISGNFKNIKSETPEGGGLTGDKAKRLAELRAKKAAGTLGK